MTINSIDGATNHLLRQCNQQKAEALIGKLKAALFPPQGEAAAAGDAPPAPFEPVSMPDAIASLSTLLAIIVGQADEKQRHILIAVIGKLIAENLSRLLLARSIEAAAQAAAEEERVRDVAAARGTANGLPI